ncbi:MAG: hypothetical protein U0350_33885 [Caldilineaceae bacterium]
MKAYIAIKYHEDCRNKKLIEGISAALEANEIETTCIIRDVEQWGKVKLTPKELMEASFQRIDTSDLIIIELTEKGTGLGIEAGYAYAKQIRIITIAQSGSDISTTLQGISDKIFVYERVEELVNFFATLIGVNGY